MGFLIRENVFRFLRVSFCARYRSRAPQVTTLRRQKTRVSARLSYLACCGALLIALLGLDYSISTKTRRDCDTFKRLPVSVSAQQSEQDHAAPVPDVRVLALLSFRHQLYHRQPAVADAVIVNFRDQYFFL